MKIECALCVMNPCRWCKDPKRDDFKGCSCDKEVCHTCFKDGQKSTNFKRMEEEKNGTI